MACWLVIAIRRLNYRLTPALIVGIFAATATPGSAEKLESSTRCTPGVEKCGTSTDYHHELNRHIRMALHYVYIKVAKYLKNAVGDSFLLEYEKAAMAWMDAKKKEAPDDLYLLYFCGTFAVVVVVITQRCFTLNLIPKIQADFKKDRHIKHCDFDNEEFSNIIRPKRHWKRAWYWIQWSSGALLAVLLILDSAPQLLWHPAWHNQKANILQTVIGFYILVKKLSMMESKTLEGNLESVFNGMKDTTWVYYGVLELFAEFGLFVFLGLKDACFLPEDRYKKVWFFGGVIRWFLLCAMSTFILTYAYSVIVGEPFSKYWFHVRTYAIKGNNVIDPSFSDVITTYIEPSRIWDRYLLHQRMQARMEDHCCEEYKKSRNLKYITAPEIMVLEEKLFQQPIVNDIDSYTRLMIFFTKAMQVEQGRLNPVKIQEVNKPWAKRPIKTFKAPICGLRVALWDELYSEDGVALKTESSSSFSTALKFLHSKALFHKNEVPIFFDSELEGVLTYEAVVASWAADCNVRWKDLVNDVAFERMAFGGILQSYLVSWKSKAFHDAKEKHPGKISESTYYICDYTWISEYEAKDNCLPYGFLACFDKHRKIEQIYVCHWDREKSSTNAWVDKYVHPSRSEESDDDIKKSQNWEHAKYVIKATVGAGHTLNEHLLCCHFIVSNTAALACRTTLDWDHPVRRLLQTFTMRTPSINFAATLTLTPEDRFAHRASSLKYGEFARLFEDCAKNWKFDTFPTHVKDNGVTDIPWAEDGLALWEIISRFAHTYVTLFYGADDVVVSQDEELKAFWKMVDNMPRGPEGSETEDKKQEGYGYKLPEQLTRQSLVDYLTHVIFWVTGNHEYFGALAEYFTTPAGLTTKIYDHEHPRNKMKVPQHMNDVQAYMQDLCIISATGVPQPKLISEWDHLMHLPELGPPIPLTLRVRRWPFFRLFLAQELPGQEPRKEWQDLKLDDSHVVQELKQYTKNICNSAASGKQSAKACFNSAFNFESAEELLKEPEEGKIARQNKILTVVHAAFMEELHDLDGKIKKKNESRDIPFEAFRPMNLECSVNI